METTAGRRRQGLCILLLCFATSPASAEEVVLAGPSNVTGPSFFSSRAAIAADLDGDGDLDLAGAGGTDRITWWESDGGPAPVWTEHDVSTSFGGAFHLEAADIDGDGDIDLVGAAIDSDRVTWWESDGGLPPAWTEHDISTSFGGGVDVAAADIDGDGDIDVAGAANSDDRITWWESDGLSPPSWTEHDVSTSFDVAFDVEAADIDGDGDIDLLGAGLSGRVTWWENDGAGSPGWAEHDVTFAGIVPDVEAADIDGDGDLDLVITDYSTGISWWENDGTAPPAWTAETVYGVFPAGAFWDVEAADIDGDSDLDLVAASTGNAPLTWWENSAAAGSWTGHTVADFSAWHVEAADIDGDGVLDLVAGGSGSDRIAWWEGGGGWIEHDVSMPFVGPLAIEAADLDADGDLDLVGAFSSSGRVGWWESDSSGPIDWVGRDVFADFGGAAEVEAADIDGDGDVDLFGAASADDQVAWWENDGSSHPVWTEHDVAVSFDGATDVGAADIDGDGDLDLFGAARYADRLAWWENNGGDPPVWTERDVSTAFDGAADIGAADIDGDGDLDLVAAASTADRLAWWENSGSDPPAWTEHDVATSFNGAADVEPIDIDGDGDIDVLAAASVAGRVAWWENDGSSPPAWTENLVTTSFQSAQDTEAADIDGDGDIDIVATASNSNVGRVTWWDNDGSSPPVWTEHDISPDLVGAMDVEVADLDGDGDLDIVVTATDEDVVVTWENQSTCDDLDGDGVAWGPFCLLPGGDCDDTDPDNHPGNSELCDGVDNDCDGLLGAIEFDDDGDGLSECDGDCVDTDPNNHPDNQEVCDGADNDCDGTIDEAPDHDSDDWTWCDDCDDSDASINPGALEICDDVDNDCDDNIDEGFDADGDGWTTCAGDCDDTEPSVNPGAVEVCDGLDNDCDDLTDESLDSDGDGWTVCDGDCDDADSAVHPGAVEVCDGRDNDCDDDTRDDLDGDGDGLTLCDGDCDDTDPAKGDVELCDDGIDNDCDGLSDTSSPSDPVCWGACAGCGMQAGESATPREALVPGLLMGLTVLFRRRRRPLPPPATNAARGVGMRRVARAALLVVLSTAVFGTGTGFAQQAPRECSLSSKVDSFDMVTICLERGDPETAIRILAREVEGDPTAPHRSHRHKAAQILIWQGHWDLAAAVELAAGGRADRLQAPSRLFCSWHPTTFDCLLEQRAARRAATRRDDSALGTLMGAGTRAALDGLDPRGSDSAPLRVADVADALNLLAGAGPRRAAASRGDRASPRTPSGPRTGTRRLRRAVRGRRERQGPGPQRAGTRLGVVALRVDLCRRLGWSGLAGGGRRPGESREEGRGTGGLAGQVPASRATPGRVPAGCLPPVPVRGGSPEPTPGAPAGAPRPPEPGAEGLRDERRGRGRPAPCARTGRAGPGRIEVPAGRGRRDLSPGRAVGLHEGRAVGRRRLVELRPHPGSSRAEPGGRRQRVRTGAPPDPGEHARRGLADGRVGPAAPGTWRVRPRQAVRRALQGPAGVDTERGSLRRTDPGRGAGGIGPFRDSPGCATRARGTPSRLDALGHRP